LPEGRGRIVLGALEDHSDYTRRGTLYEEFNPTVIKELIDVLSRPSMSRPSINSSSRIGIHDSP